MIEAVVLAAAVVCLAVVVATPLYRPPDANAPGRPAELRALADSLVSELAELRTDHAAGLVDAATYAARRDELEVAAAAALRRLESQTPAQPPAGDP